MNIGIVGASGYIGETLVRLLARHPRVNLTVVTSRKLAGTAIEEAIPALRCQLPNLKFTDSDASKLAGIKNVDLYFLALPHGVAVEYARALVDAGKKVIDLSADFRLDTSQRYEEFYGAPHPDPDLLSRSAYVIPEIHNGSWKDAPIIGCPGCYPTSILIPIIPLLSDGVISDQGIVVNSLSGVSGAGKKAEEYYSYCERAEDATPYGVPKHRHLSEIEQQLSEVTGKDTVIQFTPHLVPMIRGIITTIIAPANKSMIEDIYTSWEKAYSGKPFISILPSGTSPHTSDLLHTNRIDISASHDPRTGNFIIHSAEDNLMKGAGGQAVQIMNLMLGIPEDAGLI
jgi:N-acetyl-gamma-glutamyl-phosphate reductase